MDVSPNLLNRKNMPDVSVESRADLALPIHRVGMRKVQMPALLNVAGQTMTVPVELDAFVSLDKAWAKGIHMSRLYLQARDWLAQKELSFSALSEVLEAFLESHQGLSNEAELSMSFQLPVKRRALISGEVGWRQYPVRLSCERRKGQSVYGFEFEVLYSSTCPCSAALARQLRQEKFTQDFSHKERPSKFEVREWLGRPDSAGGVAHAQRSRAQVRLTLINPTKDDLVGYIDGVEAALGTPVQAAVKREDEQEFARLNAENLMFCEDAGRKLQDHLNQLEAVKSFEAEVVHEESLHPHNAVAVITGGK